MNRPTKIISISLSVVLVSYIALFWSVKLFGREWAQETLHRYVAGPVHVKEALYQFPFGLKLKEITLGEKGRIRTVIVHVDPYDLIKGNVSVSSLKVIRPDVSWTGFPELSVEENSFEALIRWSVASLNERFSSVSLPVLFKNIIVSQGRIIARQELGPLKILDKDILYVEAEFDEVKFKTVYNDPKVKEVATSFEFSSRLKKWNEMPLDKEILAYGWIAPGSGGLSADLIIKEYKQRENFRVKAQANNYDLIVEGVWNLRDALAQHDQLVDQYVLSLLGRSDISADGLTGHINFMFKSDLKDFAIDRIDFWGEVKEGSNMNVLAGT